MDTKSTQYGLLIYQTSSSLSPQEDTVQVPPTGIKCLLGASHLISMKGCVTSHYGIYVPWKHFIPLVLLPEQTQTYPLWHMYIYDC